MARSQAGAGGKRKTGKQVLTLIHRWVGLVLAVLVLLQAGTGLLLVNKDALEPLLSPGARVAPAIRRAPLDTVFANLQAARPDLRLDRIYTPRRADRALTARMVDKARRITIVQIDPSTARVISAGPIQHYPLQLAERLHVSLMQGAIGQVVLLVEGLCLLFMSISGLIVWWPRIELLKSALTIHTDAGARRLWRDLHLVPGAIAAVFIAVSAFTAVGIIADPVFKAVVGLVAPVSPGLSPPKMAPVPAGRTPLTAQAALEKLSARFPEGRLRQIRVFGPRERLIGVVMESGVTLNPRAHHLAAVDRATGDMTIWADGDHMPSGDAVIAWLLPTHTGEVLGPARGVLMSLLAVTLMLLTISGVWMWISKPRRHRAAR